MLKCNNISFAYMIIISKNSPKIKTANIDTVNCDHIHR